MTTRWFDISVFLIGPPEAAGLQELAGTYKIERIGRRLGPYLVEIGLPADLVQKRAIFELVVRFLVIHDSMRIEAFGNMKRL